MGPGRREECASLLGDGAGEFGAGADSVYRGPPRTGGFEECDEEPLTARQEEMATSQKTLLAGVGIPTECDMDTAVG